MNPRSRESEEIRPNNYYVYVILHKKQLKEFFSNNFFFEFSKFIVPMLHQMLKSPKIVVLVIRF